MIFRLGSKLAALMLLTQCAPRDNPFPSNDETVLLEGMHHLSTVPTNSSNAYANSLAAQALGEQLFHDVALSSCGTVACATCHSGAAFADGQKRSKGCAGLELPRNTPSVLNAGFAQWLSWDGHKDTLWAHASRPLMNPTEMNSTPSILRNRLVSYYASQYQALFGNNPASDEDNRLSANFGKAVEAYVRTLNTPRAPFDDDLDRFLAVVSTGNQPSIEADPAFLRFKTFVRTAHCTVCHDGPVLGGSTGQFRNIGLADSDTNGNENSGRAGAISDLVTDPLNALGEYSDDRNPSNGGAATRLQSLISVAGPAGQLPVPDSLGAFKVPSLRGVKNSAPYMHDGSIGSLSDIVEFYNRGGDADGTFAGSRSASIVPLKLSAEEKAALIDLLNSL